MLEGSLDVVRIIWCLIYYADRLVRALPAPKLEKAAVLLHLSDFDVGCIKIRLILLQEVRGNEEFWVSVIPQLAPLLGATNALLGPPTQQGLAAFSGSLRTRARKWLAFWESNDLMRLLVGVKAHWETRFTNQLVNALHVTEMLAMPSLRDSLIWATGDATLDRWSFICWSTNEVMTGSCEFLQNALAQMNKDSKSTEDELMDKLLLLDQLSDHLETSDNPTSSSADHFGPCEETSEETYLNNEKKVIIGLCELWALIGGLICLALRGTIFDRTVLYASDNSNVRTWLKDRDSNCLLVRFLLLILAALESSYRFRVFCEYLRTYHNEAADAFTRKAIADLLVQYGLTHLSEPDWAPFFHRGWAHRALTWVGQDLLDEQVALQLSVKRSPPGPSAQLPSLFEFGKGHFFVVREHLANGGLAFVIPANPKVIIPKLLESRVVAEQDIGPVALLIGSRPPLHLLTVVLPPLLTKHFVQGAFFDYPSRGEA